MFQGFSNKTAEFLWELRFHNERPWFQEHKQEFEELLNQPFKELAAETLSLMRQRWPEQGFQAHVSRIYRDARRLFGRGPYKDHLWFAVHTGERHTQGPMFWFEIGAATYSYGLGFWDADPDKMAAYRRLIDANPARFERLVKALERRGDYRLWGQEYKRPKGDYGEPISRWYSRKYISVGREKDFGGALLTAELPRLLTETFEELMPMHRFFWEFYHLAAEQEPRA